MIELLDRLDYSLTLYGEVGALYRFVGEVLFACICFVKIYNRFNCLVVSNRAKQEVNHTVIHLKIN